MTDLQYFEKWEVVRMENKEMLRRIDVILLEEQKKSFPTLAVPGVSSNNDFIRINPAPNTKQAYLEKVSSMLDVNVFIEQATYYINNGFKSKPPQLQTFGKSA